MVADDSIEELRRMKQEARQSGGPERMAARRKNGIGTARERVLQLLDPDTFVELDVFVEGAVAGHGRVGDRDVYVFSQDGEAEGEAFGEGFVRKVVKVMDLAAKNGAPLVGIYDGGQSWSNTDAGPPPLGGCSPLFLRNVLSSGLVPQIAAVMGPCTGSAVFSPALSDFVVMVKGGGHMLLGDPRALTAGAVEDTGPEEVGGARALSEMSGIAHLAADDEAECLDLVRELLSFLPQNNLEDPPMCWTEDPADRMEAELDKLALATGGPADLRAIIGGVVDDGRFMEIMPRWAKNLVVGFARLAGSPVGIVGNQAGHLEGRIDQDAAIKGSRFVRFCDAFNSRC